MIDPDKLCMGCMRQIRHEKICPYCGFSLSKYQQIRSNRALPPLTILGGRYMIGKLLGEGGFGITYLALDLRQSIPMAVKEFFPAGLAFRDTSDGKTLKLSVLGGEKGQYFKTGLKNFYDEARNLQRLKHVPDIISVMDFFYENNTAYLVMEFVEGKTLKEYLEEQKAPLSEKEALRLIRPVLSGLSQIHRAGMIHRDISPENIMLKSTMQAYLIDFGSAKILTGIETKSMTVLLKHGYAPIEQYQVHGRQGPWTDIYAVCATIYRMLSGKVPDEAVDRMVEDKMESLEHLSLIHPNIHVSSRISKVVQKGLSLYSKDRFQSVEQLVYNLYTIGVSEKNQLAAVSGQYDRNAAKETNILYCKGENNERNAKILLLCSIGLLFLVILLCSICLPQAEGLTRDSYVSSPKKEIIVSHQSGPDSQSDISTISEVPEPQVSIKPELRRTTASEFNACKLERVTVANVSSALTFNFPHKYGSSPELAFDNDTNTYWCEYISPDQKDNLLWAVFDKAYDVNYLSLRLGNWTSVEDYYNNSRPKLVEITLGNNSFQMTLPDSMEEYYLEVSPPVKCSIICIEILDFYEGTIWKDPCITDIDVYEKN